MTAPNPMSREELLEYAALDAFGLLDEYEAALYTRSFHHAPAAVQNEILQLQAELVSDETFLPNEQPDPTLRHRVLEAVADAIERETEKLAPLASIGRPRAMRNDAAGRFRIAGGGSFWRAAAFVLCAGLIVVAYFWSAAVDQGNQIAVLALSNNTDAQLEKLIGPTFKDYFFDPSAKTVVFKPKDATSIQRAALLLKESSDEAFLVFEGLPWTPQGYTLSVRHADGTTEHVEDFESTGRLWGMHVKLSRAASQFANVTWEISDASGVLLASI